jgi:opacity protein-like surface antigen
MRTPSAIVSRLMPLLAVLALPGLALAQYAPYAPPPAAPPPPPPPAYPPPPPGYPPGYGPPPAHYSPQQQQVPVQQSGGRIQLSGFAGWVTSSNINSGAGYLRIDPTISYGAEVAFAGGPGTKLALRWIYYRPEVQFISQSYSYSSSNVFNVGTNYFLIAGEKGYRRGKVEPFFGGSFGGVWYSPDSFKLGAQSYNPSDSWYFAFGLGAGVKVFVADKVALRLGIEMLAPLYFSGGYFYAGTGGSGMGVSAGIPTVSGNFTAGLTFSP